jgi:hypothetical protein
MAFDPKRSNGVLNEGKACQQGVLLWSRQWLADGLARCAV